MTHDQYKQLSDRIACEVEKTFRLVKKEKIPKFSFFMRLVKLKGADEVVRILGGLRESKNFSKINNFTEYIMGIVKRNKL